MLRAASGDVCDVNPARRPAGIGVDIEAIVLLAGERQLGEEASLGRAELAAGPLDGDLRLDVELFAGVADRIVMVAAHGDGAVVDEVHDGRHSPFGVGAVADIVAEQHDACGALAARRGEAGLERLPVGVDVREQRYQHGGPLAESGQSSSAGVDLGQRSLGMPKSLRGERRP